MSEHRKPSEIWKRLPGFPGTKQGKKYKIELFPAHYWAHEWEPGSNTFSPKPPLNSAARKIWWETHYRIRVNGVFVGSCTKGEMQFLTREDVLNIYFS